MPQATRCSPWSVVVVVVREMMYPYLQMKLRGKGKRLLKWWRRSGQVFGTRDVEEGQWS